MAKNTIQQYVLVDEDGETLKFTSEEELEKYLKNSEYDEDEIEDLQVFAYTQEYIVVLNKGYELEEVEV